MEKHVLDKLHWWLQYGGCPPFVETWTCEECNVIFSMKRQDSLLKYTSLPFTRSCFSIGLHLNVFYSSNCRTACEESSMLLTCGESNGLERRIFRARQTNAFVALKKLPDCLPLRMGAPPPLEGRTHQAVQICAASSATGCVCIDAFYSLLKS